jgi:hypothetical protein
VDYIVLAADGKKVMVVVVVLKQMETHFMENVP